MSSTIVTGRLAPSPTGALHLGNARSFLLAWLSARQAGGRVLLRIEDIDSPRIKAWATQATLTDLTWLGLDWDYSDIHPAAADTADRSPVIQSQRLPRYAEVLQQLIAGGKVYRCTCTRSEVAEAASAPHESLLKPLEGPIYPGSCRATPPTVTDDVEFSYRWAFDEGRLAWVDGLRGPQSADPLLQLGDFVIARGNGLPAYQLAVVVDDQDMGVTEVVRGDDLIASTFRQLAILRFLGWPAPSYFHVPLMVGPDGRRLAKRHGDTRVNYFRDAGIPPEALIGFLAWTLNMNPHCKSMQPQDLIGKLDWSQLPTTPTVFDLSSGMKILHGM